jgi:hypothetical protein
LATTRDGAAPNGAPFRAEWLAEDEVDCLSSVTLIVAAPADKVGASRWWRSLIGSLPRSFAGDIVTNVDPSMVQSLPTGSGSSSPLRVTYSPDETGVGFLNRAAALATGDFLIILTPWVIPLTGWLAPLCDLLQSDARVGAVGGKIFTPDGRLEEAGAVVFGDATIHGFGTGDYRAEEPLYQFVRDTACCSTRVLATRRAQFEELGRFDPAFHSFAYAFADYCFRASRLGRRLCYQPESQFVLAWRTDDEVPQEDRTAFLSKWTPELGRMPHPRTIWDRNTWHSLAVS